MEGELRMIVLGINGQFNTRDHRHLDHVPPWFFHDAAAALLVDGELVCAVEEERLTRIKHTNEFPVEAIRACLATAGITLADVDKAAFFFGEEYTNKELFHRYIEEPGTQLRWARELIHERLTEVDGRGLSENRLDFIEHHPAHAASALVDSGHRDALVVVIDGNGEEHSISAYNAEGGALAQLATVPTADSLGHLYTRGTELLGYRLFDEYKVMGLAPLGDPATYRAVLRSVYELGDHGTFQVRSEQLRTALFRSGYRPRRSGEAFTAQHRDLAAAIQEATETIALHAISNWLAGTGHRQLVIAGGVAQNSTLNGKLLRNSKLGDVFVHPAAHDSGAAYGAALLAEAGHRPLSPLRRRSVYLGPCVEREDVVENLLDTWSDVLEYSKMTDIADATAELLANDKIVGWVQGRSEFGPRALGNRSILADPRPRANKDRVNFAVKQREGYRPFAPSVQAEHCATYFDIPGGKNPDFMTFTVPVRPSYRSLLGAVTHKDGTSRVHAVDKVVNERFWRLLDAFGARTGVPMLLNTSFNNHAEPIVQSALDAVICYLTTGLDHLIIGDLLISRRLGPRMPLNSRLELAQGVRVEAVGDRSGWAYALASPHMHGRRVSVSEGVAIFLTQNAGDVLRDVGIPNEEAALAELTRLWQERYIQLLPAPTSHS